MGTGNGPSDSERKEKCILCDSHDSLTPAGINTIFDFRRTVYFCESCRLYFLGAQPAPTELEKFYTENYYSVPENSGLIYKLRSRFSLIRAWSQYLFMHRIIGRMGFKSGKSILEVGSSDGVLLAIFRKRGWKIRGLEYSDFSVRKARETRHIELERKDILELDPDAEKFDCIVLSHSLEHMNDPVGVLEHCKRLLSPHGHIFVELPLAPLAAECTAEELGLYLNTTHLYDFRPDSLEKLACSAGLKKVALARYFYHIPALLNRYSAAVGKSLMTGTLPLEHPLELGPVLGAAVAINARFIINADPMMPVDIEAPWIGFGDVLRIMLAK